MSNVTTCPHCQLKLAVRSELMGQKLACPKCKGTFCVPGAEVPPPEALPAAEAAEPSLAGPQASGLDFLEGLSSGNSMSATATAANKSQPPAGKTSASPAGRPSTASVSSAGVKGAGRASNVKGKANPMLPYYIGGGIGAVILLLIVAVVAVKSGKGGNGKPDIKFGLSKGQRQHIFTAAMEAVDNYGEAKAKSTEWPKLAAEFKITPANVERILDEGFNSNWLQPAFSNYNAEAKARRVEWLKNRNERTVLKPRR